MLRVAALPSVSKLSGKSLFVAQRAPSAARILGQARSQKGAGRATLAPSKPWQCDCLVASRRPGEIAAPPPAPAIDSAAQETSIIGIASGSASIGRISV